MTPCRDCKADVSTSAKACPKCGALSPATGKFLYFLNRFAHFCFWAGLVLILLQIAFAFAAHAGDHRHVHAAELESGECYIVLAPEVTMWRHRFHANAGAWSVPEGNIICVREVERTAGRPWYRVLIMKTGTLDRSEHIPGWIDSRELEPHGVTLSY